MKNNGNFLQRSKSSIRPSPRTPSLTASLLSRRSGYDDRLDRITKMLELLVEDKARKGSRRDSDCEDDASEEDPSISSRRGRQSLRSRDSGSTLSRQRSPHHARYGSLEPGFQDRQLAYQGPQNERKKGFSSYVKSGVKEAAKLGFKQVKESMLGQTPEDSADTLARSQFQLQRKWTRESHPKDPSERMASRRFKTGTGESRDRHNRFHQEVLGRQDDSLSVNENLLEGLLPPKDGYDFSKPSSSHIGLLQGSQNRKGVLELSKHKSPKGPNSADRPLHFDPSLPSVQSFAWPDAQEIAERTKTEIHDNDGHAVDEALLDDGTGTKRSTTTPTRPYPTSSNHMYESIDVLVPPYPVLRATKTQRTTKARKFDTSEEDFGIVWPSTPTHEPFDNNYEHEEDLPKYVSPTTEVFAIRTPYDRELASISQAMTPDPMMYDSATNGLLFERIISTMSTCLGKLMHPCPLPRTDSLQTMRRSWLRHSTAVEARESLAQLRSLYCELLVLG